jgi:hypothetical protein
MNASETFRRRSGQAGCIALAVLGLCVLAGPRQAQSQGNGKGLPPGPDVRVIKTPANPVPVVGQVAVHTTEPLAVTDVPRQPFQTFLASAGPFSFEVPAGKRLVIEHVSGHLITDAGAHWVQVSTTAGGTFTTHLFPVTSAGLAGNGVDTVFPFAQETRLYADPGSTVFWSYATQAPDVDISRYLAISGYLVDVP